MANPVFLIARIRYVAGVPLTTPGRLGPTLGELKERLMADTSIPSGSPQAVKVQAGQRPPKKPRRK